MLSEILPLGKTRPFFLFNTLRLSVSVYTRSALLTPSKDSDREIVTSLEHERVSWLSAQSFADNVHESCSFSSRASMQASERTYTLRSFVCKPAIYSRVALVSQINALASNCSNGRRLQYESRCRGLKALTVGTSMLRAIE